MFIRKKPVAWLFLLLITPFGFLFSLATGLALAQSKTNAPGIVRYANLLPTMEIPPDNPQTKEKIELGKMLFFDPRLSGNNRISCATCHNPKLGWSDGLPRGKSVTGDELSRNVPTIFNAGLNRFQMWDGRFPSLEEQALKPVANTMEMNQEIDRLPDKLKAIPGYVSLFKKIFNDEITLDNIAKAIASFERTVVSTNSPYDRSFKGDEEALSPMAQKGRTIFFSQGRCAMCHGGYNFTDNLFHNLGVPDLGPKDLGRYNVTLVEYDTGAFKTPTLRSVALNAPYMHNGIFNTLEEVVEFYNLGGGKNKYLDPVMTPLKLSEEEKTSLVEFLKSLTGEEMELTPPALPQ